MFLSFFYALRAQGIPVSPGEWFGLCEALVHHPNPTLHTLYALGRSICVKHESLFDAYDQVFAAEFGAPLASALPATPSDAQQFLDALRQGGAGLRALGFDLPPAMVSLLAEHRAALERMIAESEGEGLRGEGPGGKSNAVAIAKQRKFKNYRADVVLDTRVLRVALSRLRRLLPTGPRDELDLAATVDASGRNGGEIELVYRRRRSNDVRIVLVMDAGGSMLPHASLVNRLFSAASGQFRELRAYYFHNCIYHHVYADIERRLAVPTEELLRLGPQYWLIAVGDAHMNTLELIRPHGAIEGPKCPEPGLVWLKRVRDAFRHSVWLNPLLGAADLASGQSVQLVQSVFPMYPLTLDGLESAVRALLGRR